jgi:hypothetical protein
MNASKRMDGGGFERLLDVYGARLERWPEELRAAAREWLESSEAAKLAWQRASRLDDLLDAPPEVEPSASLMARIAAIPITVPAPHAGARWPLGAAWASLLGWGVAAVLGIWVGGVAAPMFEPVDASVSVWDDGVSEEAALSDEWSDLSELALGAGLAGEEEQ